LIERLKALDADIAKKARMLVDMEVSIGKESEKFQALQLKLEMKQQECNTQKKDIEQLLKQVKALEQEMSSKDLRFSDSNTG
jgi:peptidoglycan hydrolase CwlO-like protein